MSVRLVKDNTSIADSERIVTTAGAVSGYSAQFRGSATYETENVILTTPTTYILEAICIVSGGTANTNQQWSISSGSHINANLQTKMGNIVNAGIRPGIAGILPLNSSLNLDNLSIQIRSQYTGVWLFVATLSGTSTFAYSLIYLQGPYVGGLLSTFAANTTFQSIGPTNSALNIKQQLLTIILSDLTVKKMYRITWQCNTDTTPWDNNYVSIERLN